MSGRSWNAKGFQEYEEIDELLLKSCKSALNENKKAQIKIKRAEIFS